MEEERPAFNEDRGIEITNIKSNIGIIGHVDHGKTTLSAAQISLMRETLKDEVVIIDFENTKTTEEKIYPYKNYRTDLNLTNYKGYTEYHEEDDVYGRRKKKIRKQNNHKIKKRKKAKNGKR